MRARAMSPLSLIMRGSASRELCSGGPSPAETAGHALPREVAGTLRRPIRAGARLVGTPLPLWKRAL